MIYNVICEFPKSENGVPVLGRLTYYISFYLVVVNNDFVDVTLQLVCVYIS